MTARPGEEPGVRRRAFMNRASHYVDLLDWIVGPVESVMPHGHPRAGHRGGRYWRGVSQMA